jgi:hypothetical protein
MKKAILILLGLSLLRPIGHGADFLEKFGFGKSTSEPAATLATPLSQGEVSAGLKEALSKGIEHAIGLLGQENGFLKDPGVKIPVPDSLKAVERTLRTLHQDSLADEFVTTMNRAAEKAVPQAVDVLGDAVKKMTLADATSILTSTNQAATAYFRRTSETNLFERFLPIVQSATEQTGVTRTYKEMMGKASFGGFSASSFLGSEATDLDSYVTHKTLDGLFLKIGQEEKRIRENPVARTTDLLQKVFGAVRPAGSENSAR